MKNKLKIIGVWLKKNKEWKSRETVRCVKIYKKQFDGST